MLPLLHMGFSLPLGPLPTIRDGARPDDPQQGPQQIALPRDQQEEFPFQEVAPFPQFPYRSKFKFFLKPSVLQVEACLLEKIFGECAGLFTTRPHHGLRGAPSATRGTPIAGYRVPQAGVWVISSPSHLISQEPSTPLRSEQSAPPGVRAGVPSPAPDGRARPRGQGWNQYPGETLVAEARQKDHSELDWEIPKEAVSR